MLAKDRLGRNYFLWAPEGDKGGGGNKNSQQDDAARGGARGSARDGDTGNEGDQQLLKFDDWLKDQPDPVKALLDGHTKGLKSALDSERDARKKSERELREMAGKADKGSEAEAKLTALADQMAESDRRADFYDAAHAAGVSNLKLAYIAAVQGEMFDRHGKVNFEALKKDYPELFAGASKNKPAGNAGNGTQSGDGTGKTSMDDLIRAKVGINRIG